MRIYTRGGDEGKTSLFDGTRVSKADLRVEVYGTIDELNSHLSLCRVASQAAAVRAVLERVQNELFTCGADFATPTSSAKASKRLTAKHVEALEKDSDRFFGEVGNPQGFVLPGETEEGARLHVARTVCRRAERLAVSLSSRDPLNPDAVRYLNRLSSLLYSLAVWSDKVRSGRTLQNPKYE
ncbi:MAG: cob(I)yrinic acid a,c-diamide adenosyltransferase [Euryarchaeota archaeon]|nr:cob(I)yrinic acid a,c-diamide adenosyltransferase [Euryarchaeota archaeon]